MARIVMISLVLLVGPVYAQQKGWEKEWNEVMAGAKKGKVVVATSPDPVMREIAAKFKARFGITLEHLAGDRATGGNQQRRCFSWRRPNRGECFISRENARSA